MPPIINSNHTGKVTHETRDVFIECSGFDMKRQINALNVLVAALADRGGIIESVKVIYPKTHGKTITTPDLSPNKTQITPGDINKLMGLKLSTKQIIDLLELARYDAKQRGSKIEAVYPAYRQDVMHWRDVAEDAIISYGYNNIKPLPPRLATSGKEVDAEIFSRKIAEVMTGLGIQEVLSYILTNKNDMFKRMNKREEAVVEIDNVVSANWSVFRAWLIPSLLDFLTRNKHNEYPQRIFEAGIAIIPDASQETRTRDARKLACALSNTIIGYEDISSILDALLRLLGIKYAMRPKVHPSFISGRSAAVLASGREIGIIGEIHPKVLNNWGIEKPVAAFELDLEGLKKIIESKNLKSK